MVRFPKRLRLIVAAAALAGLAAVAVALARFAPAHVLYYTADPDWTDRRCFTCHVSAKGGSITDRLIKPEYLTPLNITVSPSGDRLYVTARDADRLLEIDPVAKSVVQSIPVGERPHSVVLGDRGGTAYVTNQHGYAVSVVDLAKGESVALLPTGTAPAGLAVDQKRDRLVVANWMGNDVSVLSLTGTNDEREVARFEGGANPNEVAVSPDGRWALVTNELSYTVPYPATPVGEITMIDLERMRIHHRFQLENAHMIAGAAFTPDGDYALAAMIQPRNLLPVLQVERGWTMTNALAVIDMRARRAWQLPLDDVDRFFADPVDVAIDSAGRHAFVSHGGVDYVTVLDLTALLKLVETGTPEQLTRFANDLAVSQRYVRARIPVGSNPQGLAVTPDGGTVYVVERYDDTIGVIDVESLTRTGGIALGGPEHESVVRRGAKVFHSAGNTLQTQFSCRSCHPDQHVDGLQYDFEPNGLGQNVLDNRSLRGLRGTAPFKWNGKNTSLYMQCGMRFARILTRSAPFKPDDLNALVAFISSRENFPNPYQGKTGELTPAQRRGKELFERAEMLDGEVIPLEQRCTTCHPAPLFTNLATSDIGTKGVNDSSGVFDNPHLRNIWMSAPYLHDGRARTLEEIWTVFSPNDTHGVVRDLGKEGLNDLVEYLKTL